MKNLTIKTFLIFLLLALLIMGAVYISLYCFTPYSGTEKNAEYIEKEADSLSAKCMGITKISAEKLIYEFAGQTGAGVELMDSETYLNGGVARIVGNSSALGQDGDNNLSESVESNISSGSVDGKLLTYPLRFSDQQEEYVLCVTCTSERTAVFQSSVLKSIPVVLVVALVLSYAGAKIFSYYMKKPIVRMSRIAEKMAEQNFEWYCPDERDDEIGVLAKSLNKLSDELSAALAKLSDKNLYLKNEIALEKERERRRMLFFSGVSHELKTPISVVIGQIEGMRSGIGVYKDRDKYLAKCSDTLKELVDFINEILLVAHIDMGDVEGQGTVKIDGILDEEIAFYDGMITEKKLELEYGVPDNVEFRGDEKLLKKAVGNIIGNAVKYTPDGGCVSVKLVEEEADHKVVLSVTNTPAHIDEQHLSHLFEAFYRADASSRDGSGLGLYITGMVLEMFGAEYRIENTEDGVCFTVKQ